jgi:hypothetical protein
MKTANTRLWWLSVPALVAVGSLAFALLRPSFDCIRNDRGLDVLVCSDNRLLNVLVASAGILLAVAITAFLLRIRNRAK